MDIHQLSKSDLPSPWQSLAEEGGNRKRNTQRKQGKSKSMNKAANKQNNMIKTTVNVQREKRAGCVCEFTAEEDHEHQLDRRDRRSTLHRDHIRSSRTDWTDWADVETCPLAELIWLQAEDYCSLGWSSWRFILVIKIGQSRGSGFCTDRLFSRFIMLACQCQHTDLLSLLFFWDQLVLE